MDDTVEKNVEGLAEQIIEEDAGKRAQELVRAIVTSSDGIFDETRKQDLFNIAPKRANWDLKREMEKKLAKLDRKTQEAIHTLISMSARRL